MIPPVLQRLPLRDLVDLCRKPHGSLREILILQHLANRLFRCRCERPWLHIP
ncbi:MAG: hypothetical protein IKM73_12390 [Acidaminococcaceae bacterium]|nr:hypothetical protein [Acidaminococcaceae bacterium]